MAIRADISGKLLDKAEYKNDKTGELGYRLAVYQGGRTVVQVLAPKRSPYTEMTKDEDVLISVDIVLTRAGYQLVFAQ